MGRYAGGGEQDVLLPVSQPHVERAVFAFVDCGIYEQGFARVVCHECMAEFLVAFSCQRRGLCLSCAAKRGAMLGARLCQHRVITLLRDKGLLNEERIELLLSWRHSGFSVHNTDAPRPSCSRPGAGHR